MEIDVWDDPEEREPADAEEEPIPGGFVRTSLIFYGVMGCIALVWRMWTPGASILTPSDGAVLGPWLPALGWGVSLGLVSLALSEALTRMTPLGDALADMLGEGLGDLSRGDAILLALASGCAEEMFFRGALQPVVGLVIASIAFGACHFLPRKELVLWSAYAVVMGAALGWLFETTGHLIAPIAAHVVVNAVNLPRLAERAQQRAAESSSRE